MQIRRPVTPEAAGSSPVRRAGKTGGKCSSGFLRLGRWRNSGHFFAAPVAPERGTRGLGFAVLAEPRFPLVPSKKVFRVVLGHTKAAKNSAGQLQHVLLPGVPLGYLPLEVTRREHLRNRFFEFGLVRRVVTLGAHGERHPTNEVLRHGLGVAAVYF